MPLFSTMIFGLVRWAARKGIRGARDDSRAACATSAERVIDRKMRARRTGVRGETYAYWYFRRHGYVFVSRNHMPRGVKGEIDLIGYDGETLAFVEVRTRTVPELSVTSDKQRVVARTAMRFLR